MDNKDERKPFMRLEEAAKFLGIHKVVLCRLAREKKVPAFKFCKKWTFDKESLMKFFKESIEKGE